MSSMPRVQDFVRYLPHRDFNFVFQIGNLSSNDRDRNLVLLRLAYGFARSCGFIRGTHA